MHIISITKALSRFSPKLMPEHRMLSFYPPFFFFGFKILEISADLHTLKGRLPLRWYSKNMYGSMFGGAMTLVTDPLPAILCQKILGDGFTIWTKAHALEFKRPARSAVFFTIEVPGNFSEEVRNELLNTPSVNKVFKFDMKDENGKTVASVSNTVYIRR